MRAFAFAASSTAIRSAQLTSSRRQRVALLAAASRRRSPAAATRAMSGEEAKRHAETAAKQTGETVQGYAQTARAPSHPLDRPPPRDTRARPRHRARTHV